MQALCQALDESKPHDDLNKVLNRVKRFVSLYRESNVPSIEEQDRKKQIPLVQDTLIRDLYLKGHLVGVQQQHQVMATAPAAAGSSRTSSPAHDMRDSHRNGKPKDKCKLM